MTRWLGDIRGRGLGVVLGCLVCQMGLGIVYSGSNLGGFLLTRIAGDVADASSWRAAFLGISVGGLLVLLPVAYAVVREPRTLASGTPAIGADPAADPERISETGADMNLVMALRTRSFWILAFSLFTFFYYFIALLEHLVLFLTDEGLPRDAAVAYFSNAIALGLVSKVGLGLVADRIPHKAALLVDYGVLALSSGVLLWLPHPTLLPLFIAVFGFSYAARDVVYPLMVTHCYGLRFMAPIYGALMLTLLPGGALGPIFAAAIHDHFGSYAIAFRTFAVLNALAVAALFFVRNERRHAGAHAPAGPTA